MTNHKKGRGTKPTFVTSWGETIHGAYLGSDGRLRPTGKSTPAFGGEERLAVNNFRRWQAEQSGENLARTWDEVAAMSDIERQRWQSQGAMRQDARDDATGITAMIINERERIRTLIISDPRQAAIELRIPWLADYPARPEKPQFNLKQLGEFFFANKRNKHGETLAKKHIENGKRFWDEFVEAVNVIHFRELHVEEIDRYHKQVMTAFDKGMSPSYVRGRFVQVKAVFNFGLERCQESDKPELRRVLDLLKVLKSPADVNDPKPIEPAHFEAILNLADTREKAILLLGLNALMHSGEATSTLKTDVDLKRGTLRARRPKNKNPRVAKLWPRTVEAIKAYQKETPQNQTPYLFITSQGTPCNPEVMRQIFVRLRKSAKLPDEVTFEGIRDAGFTIADEVDSKAADYIAGHQTTQSDSYVFRQATSAKVVKCCKAIEKHFFG